MAVSFDCPEIDCWQDLLEVNIPPERLERFENHVRQCPNCQNRLDWIEEGEDELRERARSIGDPTAVPADPVLSRFLQQMRDEKVLSPAISSEPVDLSFLQPCDRHGILGTLAGYEVRQVIGQGGMGVVLKAYEPALNRVVALKVMNPILASSAMARQRFIREAKAAAAVCHDHVVAIHGVGNSNGLPYLVMQYVPGESLQSRLDRGTLPEMEEVIRIGWQTAQGLAAAHAQGLIHRDVKPANLLLLSIDRDEESLGVSDSKGTNGTDGTDMSHWSPLSHWSDETSLFSHLQKAVVKITDFGLARMVDDVSLTQNGVVAGTPEYMAPEQARGETIDHRADLFSLGSVLYTLCTGGPPFGGSSTWGVLSQVSDSAPKGIRELRPDVPPWLETLIAKLMAKNPADRYQSAKEVAELLEGYNMNLTQPDQTPCPLSDERKGTRNLRRILFSRAFLLCLLCLLLSLGLGLTLVVVRLTAGGQESADAERFPDDAAVFVNLIRDADGQFAAVRSPDGKRAALEIADGQSRCASCHTQGADGKCERADVASQAAKLEEARERTDRWVIAKRDSPDGEPAKIAFVNPRSTHRLFDVEQAPDSTPGRINLSNAWLAAALIMAMVLTLTASVWLFLSYGRRGGHGRANE